MNSLFIHLYYLLCADSDEEEDTSENDEKEDSSVDEEAADDHLEKTGDISGEEVGIQIQSWTYIIYRFCI